MNVAPDRDIVIMQPKCTAARQHCHSCMQVCSKAPSLCISAVRHIELWQLTHSESDNCSTRHPMVANRTRLACRIRWELR